LLCTGFNANNKDSRCYSQVWYFRFWQSTDFELSTKFVVHWYFAQLTKDLVFFQGKKASKHLNCGPLLSTLIVFTDYSKEIMLQITRKIFTLIYLRLTLPIKAVFLNPNHYATCFFKPNHPATRYLSLPIIFEFEFASTVPAAY